MSMTFISQMYNLFCLKKFLSTTFSDLVPFSLMSYKRRQSKLAAAAAAEQALRTEKKIVTASKNKGRAKKKSSAPVYLGMFKAKILIIGPCESGKTVLANFLSDATETSGGEYHPTQGVRILEFECNNIEVSLSRTANCEVELWDCSGDHRFSTCWPALQNDTNGVVMVYNPDQPNHDKELETWYTQFVQEQWLRDSQCLIFAHHKPMAPERVRTQVPQTLSKVPCVHTNLDEDPDSVREEFKNFLGQVLSNLTDKRDQEELSIMNN